MADRQDSAITGEGTVSLNMPGAAAVRSQDTHRQQAIASFALDESAPGIGNLAVDDLHVPISSGDMEKQDDEKLGLTNDLAETTNSDSTTTNSFFRQPNFKLWSGILGTSLVLLVGVFFFLSQQTTLFKGTVTQILGDEPILEQTNPVIDTTNEGTGNTTEPIVGSGNAGSNITLPTVAEGTLIGEPIVDDTDLANILESTTNPNVPNGNDTIVIGNQPTTPNTTTGGNGTIVINDPAYNNPGNVPTDTVIIANTTPQHSAQANITNSIPTLNSNTNSQVLGSAEVQGDTGPGVLIYFVGPLGFIFYRKLRKDAA